MNLVLIGYRGTGKSAVSTYLSRLLGMEKVSLDEAIVQAAGKSIPDLVAENGWPFFRDLETTVCRTYGAKDHLILDCGGGVVEREANFLSLRHNGRVVWLRATPATILARIGGDTMRPSLTGAKSFTAEVEEVLSRRTPMYESMAHASVDTDGRTVEDIALRVAQLFRDAV